MVLLPMPMTNHKAEIKERVTFNRSKIRRNREYHEISLKQEKKFRENGRFGRSFDMLLSRE